MAMKVSALHSPDDVEVYALEGTGELYNLCCHMEYLPAYEVLALASWKKIGQRQSKALKAPCQIWCYTCINSFKIEGNWEGGP